MIRRMLLASAAVFAFALAAPINSQAQNIFVLAGISSPTGEFSDYAKTGWMAEVGLTFPVGEDGLWAGVAAGYGTNKHDEDVVGVEDGDKTNLISAMAVVGYSVQTEGSVNPYVWGGAGLQVHQFRSEMSPSFNDSSSKFGYQFGAGLSFGADDANAQPFVEGRFQGSSDSKILAGSVGVSIGIGN